MSSEIFVERFKDLILFAGITPFRLSEDTGLKLKSIHNWNRGFTYPSPKSLLVLADYFQVSTDYILGLDNREEEKIAKKEVSLGCAHDALVSALTAYMEKNQYTKYRLAKLIGVRQTTMERWFSKNAMPETAVLIRIARLVEQPLDELLGRN